MANKFGFRGRKGVAISEPLFLYIEWEEDFNPKFNKHVKDIIEEVEHEQSTLPSDSIFQTLPFITFKQAETLFGELRKQFGQFRFHGVALCSQVDKNNRLTGKATMADSPMISPFILDESYDNLVYSLIAATRRDERFKGYTHEELLMYFTTIDVNLMECYRSSLGLSRSELPLYPKAGSIPGELMRDNIAPSVSQDASPTHAPAVATSPKHKDMLSRGLAIGGLTLGVLGLVLSVISLARLNQEVNRTATLTQTVQEISNLQGKEHRIDVVSRYFLANYYSGDKDNIKAFLSSGDAKYTTPDVATLASILNDGISYQEEGRYTASYILGLKLASGQTVVKRLTFELKEDDKSSYGYVIDTEPLEEDFVLGQHSGG